MFYTILFSLLAIAPLSAANQSQQTEQHKHNEITTEQLKSWYDQNKGMIVLDARSKPYFNGTLLPNAKWVPAESTENEIQAAVPGKESLVVVYCAGVDCPASGWLYDKLMGMGYNNVYEFHEGLEGWMKKGYPTTQR